MEKNNFIKFFDEIRIGDWKVVGGKNASIGEMYSILMRKGINIPFGFALTTFAFWEFIYSNQLKKSITDSLNMLDRKSFSNLNQIGLNIRNLILAGKFPEVIKKEILDSYKTLCLKYNSITDVAVRSSATAEDQPFASFAGQHESFLNIRGDDQLLTSIQYCYASLFNNRAIKYREENNIKHANVAISAGIQKMVRSDLSCAGVAFTIEPESGFKNIIHIAGSWGLGVNIMQGNVNPDEFYVFKPKLIEGKNAIVSKRLGSKALTMIYSDHANHEPTTSISNTDTPVERQEQFVLTDKEISQIAQWSLMIEHHYEKPMDLEWAKDGLMNEIFILQAKPETVHRNAEKKKITEYKIKENGKIIATGNAIGNKIATGVARIFSSAKELDKLSEGEVLVTGNANPEWNQILKKAAAIITNKGSRTSHTSIVAREFGVAALVGTGNVIEKISDGQIVTINCAEGMTGYVYDGKILWEEKEIDLTDFKMPKTHAMIILDDPEKAFKFSFYPNDGVGLVRLEFIISNEIQIHPMALVKFNELKDIEAVRKIQQMTKLYPNKEKYFVDKLSQAAATIACAFYPKDVIIQMSDFKSTEYANLIGGKEFEMKGENYMPGFRGASRYNDDRYKDGFRLECEAMKIVRDEMGLTNVKLMIPFCRTVEEGEKVVALMNEYGLKRGENGFEIYVMAEIPSNVLQAEAFAKVFDGCSIFSNDLTTYTLGFGGDNSIISDLYSEKNSFAMQIISLVILKAKNAGAKIGLCGQAPSDFPEFARFLVEEGIDSISFYPDSLMKGIDNIKAAEESINKAKNTETITGKLQKEEKD